MFREWSTFQGNWVLEVFIPTVSSSSTFIAQMEPYLPIKSMDEGIDGAQFLRIERCAVSFKCCWKKNGSVFKLLVLEEVQLTLYFFYQTLSSIWLSSKLKFFPKRYWQEVSIQCKHESACLWLLKVKGHWNMTNSHMDVFLITFVSLLLSFSIVRISTPRVV